MNDCYGTSAIMSNMIEAMEGVNKLFYDYLLADARGETSLLDESLFNCKMVVSFALHGAPRNYAEVVARSMNEQISDDARWVIYRTNLELADDFGAAKEVNAKAVDKFIATFREALTRNIPAKATAEVSA